jgi:hypothetical protein
MVAGAAASMPLRDDLARRALLFLETRPGGQVAPPAFPVLPGRLEERVASPAFLLQGRPEERVAPRALALEARAVYLEPEEPPGAAEPADPLEGEAAAVVMGAP